MPYNSNIKPINEVCPNCVERLQENKKKMGGKTNWFICPKCGYRERPIADGYRINNMGKFIDRIRINNENGNKKKPNE